MPVYDLAPGPILKAVEHASSVACEYSDDAGEFFSMAMAELTEAAQVPAGAIIVLPLSEPEEDQSIDFSFLASSPLLYLQVFATPQPRMTYCHVAGYSTGTTDRPFGFGQKLKFPSAVNYVVAKEALIVAVQEASGLGGVIPGVSAKRVCVRQLDSGGELAGVVVEKAKGAYPLTMTDLDDVTYPTRNKTDLVQRERELYLILRMMDVAKREYVMTTDMVIQPEVYRSVICEMSDSQPEDVIPAFISCSLISRMQVLTVFRDKTKLKLLLTGTVLIETSTEPSLTLEDFVTSQKISNKSSACPSNNIGMVSVLENLQLVLQVVFSDDFTECFREFIDKLHGVSRPMFLVPADLLRYSVEMALRKFFRMVRSVKGPSLPDQLSLRTPGLCVAHLKSLFGKIADNLSHFPTMQQHDSYFRFRRERRNEMDTPSRAGEKAAKVVTPTVKFDIVEKERQPTAPPLSTKPCSGYLGGLLGAKNKKGLLYKCDWGANCSYRHIAPEGKSTEKLLEYIASMSPTARVDLRRAIKGTSATKV